MTVISQQRKEHLKSIVEDVFKRHNFKVNEEETEQILIGRCKEKKDEKCRNVKKLWSLLGFYEYMKGECSCHMQLSQTSSRFGWK